MNIIVQMLFGSHLYGTNTPNSDTDMKGIFMPEANQILLGNIPKCMNFNTKKNSSEKNSPEISAAATAKNRDDANRNGGGPA